MCFLLPLNWISLWTLTNSYLNDSFSQPLKPGTFLPALPTGWCWSSSLNGYDNSG